MSFCTNIWYLHLLIAPFHAAPLTVNGAFVKFIAVYIINRILDDCLEIENFFSYVEKCLTCSFRSLHKKWGNFQHSKRNFITWCYYNYNYSIINYIQCTTYFDTRICYDCCHILLSNLIKLHIPGYCFYCKIWSKGNNTELNKSFPIF